VFTRAIWIATDDGLYRRAAATDAWQRTWEKKPGRLPGGNHDIFAVPWQDTLYVTGGWSLQWGLPAYSHIFDELFAYDGQRQYWQVISHMSFPRRYNGIAQLAGRIWIVGDEGELGERHGARHVLDAVEIYDPANATWIVGPSLNQKRTDPFVMAHNDRIYAIGGASENSGPKVSSVESSGIGESVWRFETPLPEPTRQGHGCVLNGILYCVSIDGVFAFDAASGIWDEDLPQPGAIGQGPLAAAYGDEVWVIGGYEAKDIRCYSPKTKTWRAGPDLPTERSWGAATVMNGQLFIVGGAHRSQLPETVVFDDRTYVLRLGAG
jgi:hypothetical protein